MLQLTDLRKVYGPLVAVDSLNLSLQPGDIFGFIGPNGAGKTTTIRMIATLLQPTSGKATIDGIDVVQNPMEVRPLLGYMPDFFGLYDDIKVWEYLDFFAAAYRIPRNQRPAIISSVLELTDLTIKRDAFVQTLSRGMQQRLCLAKCLVHDPKVLLLDEPASGLDPRARIEIKSLISELGRMGKTVIVSSHILPELADFCNKVGIIERGKLLVSGAVEEIVRKLQPHRLITIRVLGEAVALQATLEGIPKVSGVKCEEAIAKVEFHGSLEEQAEILHRLIIDGHRIAAFSETAMDLEEVFMQVTREGAVQ